MSNNIVILGAGGHAKAVIDTVERQGFYRIIGLLDKGKTSGELIYGYEILGDESWLEDPRHDVDGAIVAIGDNWTRGLACRRMKRTRPNLAFVTAIHPSAVIARGARIGEGSVIMAGAYIGCDASIGDHAVLYSHSLVEHDSRIGDFVSFAPKAAAGGNVTVGDYTAIAIGASIIHGATIGEHSVIGAGSTVIRDVASLSVAFGTPARIVRSRVSGERYL
jgi:sugar O-acyltransferase (sialic acid O-acetyltransferase NeuD family)